MEWAEELPTQCPPPEAVRPDNAVYYRYVENIPLTEKDFHSHQMRYPERNFEVGNCISRSLSVYDDLEAAKRLRKLPAFKSKQLVELVLPPESGVIMRTGKPHHYSWWRAKDFIPTSYKLVEL